MKRGWRRVNNVLAGACTGAAAVNVIAGEYSTAALALVLALWILLANSLGKRLDQERAYSDRVTNAWREHQAGRSNARERAQRISDHHRAKVLLHASGLPCGVGGGFIAVGQNGVSCPICVSLTQPTIEVQP